MYINLSSTALPEIIELPDTIALPEVIGLYVTVGLPVGSDVRFTTGALENFPSSHAH